MDVLSRVVPDGSHEKNNPIISEKFLLQQDILALAVPGSTTPFVIELFVVKKVKKIKEMFRFEMRTKKSSSVLNPL